MNKLHATVHKHLKLRHHRHTGRVLHHKHTSYRGLAVILVLTGITMMAASVVQRTAANELMSVGGTVLAPVPDMPATITTPVSGTVVNSKDTLVAGNCPLASPQVAIVVTVDNSPVGSAMCNDSNDFVLPVQLAPGAHTITAQTYTVTYGRGTDSQPIDITYKPAHQAATTTGPVASPQTPFSALSAGLTAAWSGTISGGTAPYNVLVDWGDGARAQYSIATADAQHFDHQYHSPQSYNARIAITDAAGQSTQLQYAAVAYTDAATYSAAATGKTPLFTPTMAGLYGLFLTVSSVCAIAWLEAKHAARQEAIVV